MVEAMGGVRGWGHLQNPVDRPVPQGRSSASGAS